jgi:GST-like protein
MIEVYSWATPNGHKVHIMLEECGLPYNVIPVNISTGEQFKPEFLKVNPNGKVPAIDDDGVFVFDSNAILLYLAEKTGKFLPAKTDKARGELLSWMFFVSSGVGPYAGQSVHFRNYAPEKLPYAINRYGFEAQRHFGILDARLAKQKYMLGEEFSMLDVAIAPLLWRLDHYQVQLNKQSAPLLKYAERLFSRQAFIDSIVWH